MDSLQARHQLKGWRFIALIAITLLSAAGYLLFAVWGGWDEVVSAISRVGFSVVAGSLFLALLNYLFRFLRWQHYLHILGHRVPFIASAKIYLSGFSLTATPAKSGEMLRSVFLLDYGIGYHASFGAFLSERLSDLLSVLLLATIGLWEYPEARPVCIVMGISIAFLLFFLQQESWMLAIQQWSIRRLSQKWSLHVLFLIKIWSGVKDCFSFRTLSYGLFLGIIAWAFEGIAFYLILKNMDQAIPLLTALFIYSFSMLVGAITFLPAGLGGTELMMVHLLLQQSVPPPAAVVATILIRLATLWFAVAVGMVALPFVYFRKT